MGLFPDELKKLGRRYALRWQLQPLALLGPATLTFATAL